jgi:Raf kinase inhibitor-like YbhB/YbcL family protein
MPSNEPTPSASPAPTATGPFIITSPAFTEGGAIPVENTCDGANTSAALAWSGAPSGTASFALIVDDPDAGGFVHWVVFDMGADTTSLPADVPLPAGGGPPQGANSFGKVGYGGPCPPSGTHHYRFRLLALGTRLSLSGAPKASQVLAAASGHVLGETILTGTYRRH